MDLKERLIYGLVSAVTFNLIRKRFLQRNVSKVVLREISLTQFSKETSLERWKSTSSISALFCFNIDK